MGSMSDTIVQLRTANPNEYQKMVLLADSKSKMKSWWQDEDIIPGSGIKKYRPTSLVQLKGVHVLLPKIITVDFMNRIKNERVLFDIQMRVGDTVYQMVAEFRTLKIVKNSRIAISNDETGQYGLLNCSTIDAVLEVEIQNEIPLPNETQQFKAEYQNDPPANNGAIGQ